MICGVGQSVLSSAGSCQDFHSEASVGVRQALLKKRGLRTVYADRLGQSCRFRKRDTSLQASEVFEIADVLSVSSSVVGLGTAAGIVAALAWSTLPVIQSSSDSKLDRSLDKEDEGGIKWGVMSVLSFLPLFNWLVRTILEHLHH